MDRPLEPPIQRYECRLGIPRMAFVGFRASTRHALIGTIMSGFVSLPDLRMNGK